MKHRYKKTLIVLMTCFLSNFTWSDVEEGREEGLDKSTRCNIKNYRQYVWSLKETTKLIQQTGVGCYLLGANFKGQNFKGAFFTKANLNGANFSKSILRQATFTGAHLTESHFIEAILIGAYLNDADLRWGRFEGANLSRAQLSGSNFKWATYNSKTKFPKGFNPVEESMQEASSDEDNND